jgi:alpha-1,2-mannosyltransferase
MNNLPQRLAHRQSLPILVFLASAALVLVSLLAGVQLLPFHQVSAFNFFDLRIYRASAQLVLSGHPLYSARFQLGFGFTYPPAASLLFLPLALLPARVDGAAVVLFNIALVLLIVHCTLRLRGRPVDAAARSREHAATWLTAALALWIEPVTAALGLGQIDLLIAALVLVDLTRGRQAEWGGSAIGLAAALKLTPLIFIPYLALTGRIRMAGRALGVFLCSILFAFAAMPQDASVYWGSALFQTSRVTGHGQFAGRGPANQSLRGALLRILAPDPHLALIWMLSCLLIAVSGLLLAARAARRADEALGFVLTAVTGLLICPVSWSHHWSLAVPGVLLLLNAPRPSRRGRLLTAAITALALSTSSVWILMLDNPNGRDLGVGGLLLYDIYVLAGLATIFVAAALELRRAASSSSRAPRLRLAARLRAPIPRSPGHPGGALRAIPSSQVATLDRQSVSR